jgi:hypothetical protein
VPCPAKPPAAQLPHSWLGQRMHRLMSLQYIYQAHSLDTQVKHELNHHGGHWLHTCVPFQYFNSDAPVHVQPAPCTSPAIVIRAVQAAGTVEAEDRKPESDMNTLERTTSVVAAATKSQARGKHNSTAERPHSEVDSDPSTANPACSWQLSAPHV